MLRRAVFSDQQRKGLEERFQDQKYISKPDRKKLAETLGLKDSQVKIWFQVTTATEISLVTTHNTRTVHQLHFYCTSTITAAYNERYEGYHSYNDI